jgi:hypothetical protein
MMLTRLLRFGWERMTNSGFFTAGGGAGSEERDFCEAASWLSFFSSFNLMDSSAAIL